MDVSASHCKRLLVAAFDFGTTFSGYAFSFRETPLEIQFNPSWAAGSQKLISLKTPTCVLLKPDKEFHSFGFEAENKYSELVIDDEHHGWYLFRRFKMILYDTKDLQLDTLIEDIAGKKMPALTIFGHSIRYLNMLKTLCTQTGGVQPEDIQYVLTIPAIWDQKAKQFMRKAANKGGINDDQLRIALEPEAASIWCQVATENKLRGLTDAGSKYVVVDLGGGTADITVHERMTDGTLKEIHKASGGLCGGIKVDNAYEELLLTIFGVDAMAQFKTKHVGDYLDLLRDFETKKRAITTDTDVKMTFQIPAALRNFVSRKNIETLIKKSKYRGKITFTDDKMRIEKVVTRSFFDKVLADLINHVEEILTDTNTCGIDTILLVGGFGECELVKETFKKKFPNKEVKIPEEPGLAVLRGSVRFGHLPEIVSIRVARFTYGWRISPYFDKQIHDEAKRVIYNGEERCIDVFSSIVRLGEQIPSGTEILKKGIPASKDQKYSPIQIYSSKYKDPKYVTDEGCTLLATINMDLPESDDMEDKKHYVYLTFGSTELTVRVVMKTTKKTIETVINCF